MRLFYDERTQAAMMRCLHQDVTTVSIIARHFKRVFLSKSLLSQRAFISTYGASSRGAMKGLRAFLIALLSSSRFLDWHVIPFLLPGFSFGLQDFFRPPKGGRAASLVICGCYLTPTASPQLASLLSLRQSLGLCSLSSELCRCICKVEDELFMLGHFDIPGWVLGHPAFFIQIGREGLFNFF
jgi:hypothetical protein